MTPTSPPLLVLRFPGEPQRSKHLCTCAGKYPDTRPDPAWKAWRDEKVAALRVQHPRRPAITVPVVVRVVAVFPRPGRKRRTFSLKGQEFAYPFAWSSGRIPYIGTPDWDQVQKAAVDVVVQAGLLLDDPLVVRDGGSERWYTAVGEEPHVELTLWEATAELLSERAA